MQARSRIALVTGASAGIGRAFAEELAARGFDLLVTARREDRLRALAEAVEARHGRRVHVLAADLADPAAPRVISDFVERERLDVAVLVNNAGFGVPGSYVQNPWEKHAAFLQVMVTAVAELTHHLMPGMISRRYGRIINVSSLAGLVPGTAGHTLYAASKAFLVRFSESLAMEGAPYNVHATALCPGFTYSEFHDVTGTRALVSRLPAFMWMDAAAVAQLGCDAVMAGQSVCVPGRVNRTIATLSRLLPPRLVFAASRRTASRYRKVER